jgi:hypothetical protein
MQCPHCAKPLKKVNDYVPPTCGKSECQEAAYRANMERVKPKKRKLQPKLQPKEGALKADGTKWVKVPGGLEKLELSADHRKEGKLHVLADTLREKLDRERAVIKSFNIGLTEDPARAFESSISTFGAAACLRIYAQALQAITTSEGKPELHRKKQDGTTFNTLDNLIEYSQKEVNRRAASPARSSSPTSNLMDQQYLAAWADVLEMILWS